MGIVNDLTELKTLSDGVVANKVSRFAYKERAYTQNDVNGVNTYDANQDNNIPVGTANVMKVNQTVIELGWRARASSITRMLMNHFLGRISYNLNKVNDWFNELLAKLLSSLGNPDGIALLNSNGIVPDTMLPSSLVRNVSDISPDNTGKVDLTKQTDLTKILSGSLIGQIFGRLFGTYWTRVASDIFSSVSCLKYANGIWVAGKSQDGLYWSENGTDWTPCTGLLSGDDFQCLYYTGGLWFAGSTNANAYWSVDGKAWTACTGAITSVSFFESNNFVYANDLYVCGGTSEPAWSTDGKDWTLGTVTGYHHSSNWVAYGNGIWVSTAGRDSGLLYSSDGKNWTAVNDSSVNIHTFHWIQYANGVFVAVGDKAMWSENGSSWTLCESGTGGNIQSYTSYALRNFMGVWFCLGGLSDANHLFKSFDGKTWQVVATFARQKWSLSFANGLILVGGQNDIHKSTDLGKTFEKDLDTWDSEHVSAITELEYGDGKWLCASDSVYDYGLRKSDYSVLLEKGMLQ